MKAPTQKRKPWQEERVVHQRKADNSKFYNSRTWRNFRKIELELNPLCVKCEAKGIVEPARVLDHIVRIEDGGAELTKENTVREIYDVLKDFIVSNKIDMSAYTKALELIEKSRYILIILCAYYSKTRKN